MPLPVPQLDDRDFEQLFAEARARIPVHTPEWTNFNDSDPGITIVQLFAFLTDNLLYRSNRIPEANRLKFLELLGLPLRPAAAARGIVVFRNERGPLDPPLPIPAGTELRAGKVPFRTRTDVDLLPVTSAVFIKQPQTELDPAAEAKFRLLYEPFLETDADQLQFYKSVAIENPVTGRPNPVIDLADTTSTIDRSAWIALIAPQNTDLNAVRAALANRTLTLGIAPAADSPGRTLSPLTTESFKVDDPGLVFEIASPEVDPATGAAVGAGRTLRLPVEYAENVLDAPGVVHVTLPAADQLLTWDFDPGEEGTGEYPPLVEDKDVAKRVVTWLRVRYVPPAPGTKPTRARASQDFRLSWIGVNAARVIQAVPVVRESLGTATGAPEQRYTLANTPVLKSHGAVPVVEVQTESGGWEPWNEVDDLRASGPDAKDFTLDPEAGLITFGSGLNGLRPPPGRAIRATYEYGGGPQGSVPILAISKSPALPGWAKLENPIPTWGADAGESVAEGERNIPRHLRHRDRLVTTEDFKDITKRTPGVDMGRVEVLPLFRPGCPDDEEAAGAVTVMVIPKSDPVQPEAPVPDRQFLAAVCEWLDPRRLVTTELHVRGPKYVRVIVSVGIVPMPGQHSEKVERAVKAAVTAYLSPLHGGTSGDGWPLQSEVRVQDLEAVATRVDGVRYVDSVRMATIGADGTVATDVTRLVLSGLELPWATVFVTTGPAEDPAGLLGLSGGARPTQVPVPVVDPTC